VHALYRNDKKVAAIGGEVHITTTKRSNKRNKHSVKVEFSSKLKEMEIHHLARNTNKDPTPGY
jgi:hypothetical protein